MQIFNFYWYICQKSLFLQNFSINEWSEDVGLSFSDGNVVFCSVQKVLSNDVMVQPSLLWDTFGSQIDHWLPSQSPILPLIMLPGLFAKIAHFGIFMQVATKSMSNQLPYYAVTVLSLLRVAEWQNQCHLPFCRHLPAMPRYRDSLVTWQSLITSGSSIFTYKCKSNISVKSIHQYATVDGKNIGTFKWPVVLGRPCTTCSLTDIHNVVEIGKLF